MRRRPWLGQRGVTLIELLVGLVVFALFIVVMDALFFSANRSTRKTELAADVQQNARIAMERLTREIRESRPSEVLANSDTPGRGWMLFRSARLPADNSVFCLYVRNTTDPSYVYNPDCFTFPGGNITPPPYTSPEPLSPRGTYTPIWQRYIGYYVTDTPDGLLELRRVTAQLNQPTTTLSASMLTGGEVIAAFVETFDVALAGTTFTATLKASGTEIVQGSTVPTQEVLLPGTVLIRN